MAGDDNDSKIKTTIDAVTGLVKEVPVYQDAVQPAAKEIGKSLATITKTVNVALAPIKALVWGYEKIEDYLTKRVAEKLKDVPEENIITPSPHIAGPAVEALRYTGHNENLRELYASLLAVAMNKTISDKAHPSFVEVIKNLSSDEAILLQSFIGLNQFPKIDLKEKLVNKAGEISLYRNFSLFHNIDNRLNVKTISTNLDNLSRLGIIEIIHDEYFTDLKMYEPIENDSAIANLKNQIKLRGNEVVYARGIIRLTYFGTDFVKNVVSMK